MLFYRYEVNFYEGGESYSLKEFIMLKETSNGYWIAERGNSYISQKEVWVSKNGKKRFAYPTKRQAIISFIKRINRAAEWYDFRVKCTKRALIDLKNSKDFLEFMIQSNNKE